MISAHVASISASRVFLSHLLSPLLTSLSRHHVTISTINQSTTTHHLPCETMMQLVSPFSPRKPVLCYLRRQMRLYLPDLSMRLKPLTTHYPELQRLLQLDGELNDDIILSYSNLLLKESKRSIYIVNSLEWHGYENASNPKIYKDPLAAAETYLREQRTNRERRLSGNEKIAQIQNAECILFPINVNKCHWILGVIDTTNRRILIYDSIQCNEYNHIVQRLQIYASIYLNHAAQPAWSHIKGTYPKLNHQGQTLDCGVHVLGYMRAIAHSKHQQIDFQESDVPYMRMLFAYEIMVETLKDIGI